MQKEFLKGIEALNKTTLETMKLFGEINSRAIERFNARQLEMTADYLEVGVRQASLMGDMKDVQGVVAAQSKLMAEVGEKMVAHAKRNAEAFETTKSEFAGWFEAGLKSAAENPLAKQVASKKAA